MKHIRRDFESVPYDQVGTPTKELYKNFLPIHPSVPGDSAHIGRFQLRRLALFERKCPPYSFWIGPVWQHSRDANTESSGHKKQDHLQ